ncbi:5-dehydro-4-deoxyglucarate dehydratase [Arenivirga flava]|uniref:Probable 5-dehydro-4-deoxyglucarate dehydratase n=1 Tax=Arenivirga flava TaxID=1930060 RepID=A0AA37UN03_9MICO|nr:5-dehydro-4-deoxyglucarate dehydratase [Arenivirga flava]GMA27891.1 putative 5-dehydro-4-deoxyglucarate dehydratase [Arenivirga flava]
MPETAPDALAHRLSAGLLSFPVTHFGPGYELDEPAYREHLGWLAQHDVAALFAAGGTGEYFSLETAEVDRVVRIAIDEVGAAVPIVAPAGQGTATAVAQARAAARAGAAGLLLFPPYLTEASQEGLVEHVRTVCRATGLGVVFYQRANARLSIDSLARLADDCPNLVAVKDGVGDIEFMTRLRARFEGRFTTIGGLPTAETFALPYLELGVVTYSSALFNFLPAFALEFHAAVVRRDRDEVYRRLREVVLPYTELRDRRAGYAVSIVKAGLAAVGRPTSRVRPPLTDLVEHEVDELRSIVERAAAVPA